MIFRFFATLLVIFGFACLTFYLLNQLPETAPESSSQKTVSVYTALDKIFSEPLLKQFEKETGIQVKAVYDTELSKTVGLVNRLIAERERPQCDVFWNNEIIRTILLDRQNLLADYSSPNAKDIPSQFRHPRWTGFAARARILIVNTNMINQKQKPLSSFDFTQPAWQNKFAIAKPLFGTTSTHLAALLSLNSALTQNLLTAYKKNKCEVLAGNAMVKDAVAEGRLAAGWTDTDDAALALSKGKPVTIVVPDQSDRTSFPGGIILIPNTISLIRGAPHPENGQRLIDFLLRKETEAYLAKCASAQIPLRTGIETPANVLKINELKIAPIDWEKAADFLEQANQIAQQLFLR